MSTKRQKELALLREKEWRKCQASFPYFFSTYWTVLVPDRGIVPVDVRAPQIESAQLFQSEKRIVVVKARQIGWSTLITAYLFWKTYFFDNMPTMALSRREDPEAWMIISNIKMGYQNLPQWMRARGPGQITDNKTEVRWSNGSCVESDSSKDNPARGRTFAVLVLDEFGKMPNPDDAWGSALPATEYGQLIVIGNANGYGTRWWRLCDAAKRKLNNFAYRFYPWNVVPHRDAEWFERETSSMLPSERAAEYPENDVECWVQAGNPVFDVERLRLYPTLDDGFVSDEPEVDGTYTVWEDPDPKHHYVIGMDVSLGKGEGDYTVVNVLCVETGKHVAEWRARRADIIKAADRATEIGKHYNDAWLGVEINGVGEGVLNRLREENHYPNLYFRKTWNRAAQTQVIKYGWDTNRITKHQIVAELQDRLFSGEVATTHQELITEMMGYRYLADGTMGGLPNDDRVMSMAIAMRLWYEHGDNIGEAKNPEPPQWGTLEHHVIQEMGEQFFHNYYAEQDDSRFTMNGDTSGRYAYSPT